MVVLKSSIGQDYMQLAVSCCLSFNFEIFSALNPSVAALGGGYSAAGGDERRKMENALWLAGLHVRRQP